MFNLCVLYYLWMPWSVCVQGFMQPLGLCNVSRVWDKEGKKRYEIWSRVMSEEPSELFQGQSQCVCLSPVPSSPTELYIHFTLCIPLKCICSVQYTNTHTHTHTHTHLTCSIRVLLVMYSLRRLFLDFSLTSVYLTHFKTETISCCFESN